LPLTLPQLLQSPFIFNNFFAKFLLSTTSLAVSNHVLLISAKQKAYWGGKYTYYDFAVLWSHHITQRVHDLMQKPITHLMQN